MKKRVSKEKVVSEKTNKKTSVLESNWLVKITIAVIVIPLLIVAVLLLTSMGGKGEPILGDRFENDLVKEISKDHLKKVETALQFDGIDEVSVNLKSATLRILINTVDTIDENGIASVATTAYNTVADILPIETYFTNTEDAKMYDLEIHVYNVIPVEEGTTEQIYGVCYKNAAKEESSFDWITKAKDADVAESLLNGRE